MKPNLKSIKIILDEYFIEKDARKDAYGALLRISGEINGLEAKLREINEEYPLIRENVSMKKLIKEILGDA